MTIKELEKISPNDYHNVDNQLKEFVYKRSNDAFEKGDTVRDAITNIRELDKHRSFMREKFIEAIGGLPSSDTPLNPRVTGIIECEGFRIEKIIFESRPGIFITSNLYIPDGIKARQGAVLFLCGHHEQAKHANEYQVVCQYLVKAGLVVLAQDPVGQGERFSYYEKSLGATTFRWGTREHDYVGSQCLPLGDCLAKYFIHDAMRGVDYLCTRPEVDPGKIGVTGNSGGGTQTGIVMVCDSRIAAAAPATFIMNRQTYMDAGGAQDAEQVWPGMTAIGFDHEDILMMLAPRPLLVLAVKQDFFPIEGTRRSVARVKRFWEMYGMGAHIELFEDDSLHKYTCRLAKKAAEFFSEHLLNGKVSPQDKEIAPLEPSRLWCTMSGQVRGEIDGARFVHDENNDRLSVLLKAQRGIAEDVRKNNALAWLKERVYAYRKPCDFNVRHFLTEQANDFIVTCSFWRAQEGLFNYAVTFRDYKSAGMELPLTISTWDGGTSQIQSHIRWIRKTCNMGRAVMVLDVSGTGNIAPHPLNNNDPLDFYGVVFKLACDLIWLDDSLALMRTYDVLRALDVVETFPGIRKGGANINVHGRQSLYFQLAALLDSRINDIEITDGMENFSEWAGMRHYDHYNIMSVNIPGTLKYFDLPDIKKWIDER